MSAPPQGKALYDALYAVGYHNNTKLHHANELLKALKRCQKDFNLDIKSMLDVGCSHGAAVEKLWKLGLAANGVDISARAVHMARDVRESSLPVEHNKCRSKPCFQVASAAALPFASDSFDGIMSTDVLEHVQPKEVKLAVAELARVARTVLLLKISNRPEGSVKELKILRSARQQRGESSWSSFNLHATIRGPEYWLRLFRAHGWYLHHMLEAEPHDVHYTRGAGMGLPWECCTYVLQPRSAPRAVETARAEMISMSNQTWFERANRCLHWGVRHC